MYCRVCGAQVPDGDVFCPECGTRQHAAAAAPDNGGAAQQPGMPMSIVQPLGSFYTARKVILILSGIMVGMSLLMVLFVMTGLKSFYGYYYETESLIGFLGFYAVITLIQALVMLAIAIWQLILLNEMKHYEERFGKVVIYMLLGVMLSMISAFASKENVGLRAVLTILEAAFEILAYYHLCGAFADLTRPWDRDLADRWDFIFKLYIGIQVLGFLSGLIIGFNATNYSNWVGIYFFAFIVAAAGFGQSIYELKHVKKTLELFQRGRSGY